MYQRIILAQMLMGQSRYEDAEREVRQALAEEPDSSYAHGVLAIILAERERFAEATEEADTATRLEPDSAFAHFSRAVVLRGRNRLTEAEVAIREAIALEPDDCAYHARLSEILFEQRRWKDALQAAESGLALDPEDDGCTNLRAMCLVKLGLKAEAGEAIAAALRRSPEDDLSHANMGWTLLEQGQPKQAMERFREALRLNPQSEWARQGILEAMKAQFFIYRLMLNYFLWLSKLTRKFQWGILIGGYLGYRYLSDLSVKHPDWSPWLNPILIAYMVFAFSTWMADPLFNLVLRLSRFGRLALSREETITSTWVGLCVLGALLFLALALVAHLPVACHIAALSCAFMIPLVSHYYDCVEGTPRQLMLGLIVLMGLVGLLASVPLLLIGIAPPLLLFPLLVPCRVALSCFAYVALGSQIAVNFLVQMRPKL